MAASNLFTAPLVFSKRIATLYYSLLPGTNPIFAPPLTPYLELILVVPFTDIKYLSQLKTTFIKIVLLNSKKFTLFSPLCHITLKLEKKLRITFDRDFPTYFLPHTSLHHSHINLINLNYLILHYYFTNITSITITIKYCIKICFK